MKELISLLTLIGVIIIAFWLLGAAAMATGALFVAILKVSFWAAVVLGIFFIIGCICSPSQGSKPEDPQKK